MRWTRLLSGVALAVTAGLTTVGCTSAPASSTNGSTPDTHPAVTVTQARQVFDSYIAASARAATNNDQTAALALTEGVQGAVVKSDYLYANYYHARLPRYRYGTPTFYLPEQDRSARWFAASVQRTLVAPRVSGLGPDVIAASVAGVRLPAEGRVLMVFEQASTSRPWLLASTAQLAPGASVPKLATDGNGYVRTLPLSTTTLLARPDVAGPLQAAVVDDGPASTAAGVVASGPLTTGIYAAQDAPAPRSAQPSGDVRQWELEGSKYTRFALRTADGGALVLYPMYLNTTIEVPAELAESYPVHPGPAITIPPEFVPLLKRGTPAPRVRLITQLALAFAAVDPPPGAGKIQVIAIGGGPSYASAS